MNLYKISLLLLSFVLFANFQCRKAQMPVPPCIRQKIALLKEAPKANPPITITEYIFHERHVYLVSSPCCDQYNKVVDEDCNDVCAPSGGFTGKGDGKCANFEQEAKLVRLVWKDGR